MDPVQRARYGRVANGGLHDLAPHHTAQAGAAHQAFDGAAGNVGAFALQLAPHLY